MRKKISMALIAAATLVGSASAHAAPFNPQTLLGGLNLNLGRVVSSLPLLGSVSGGVPVVGGLPVLGGVLSGVLTNPKGGLGGLPALDGLSGLRAPAALPGLNGLPALGGL
jgi:hypothetical protein